MQTRTGLNASIRDIPMPARVRHLPISETGFPVPWFVAWIDGKPDFRAIHPGRITDAHRRRRCWICGEALGRHLAFVIGPMCAINRTSSEPPSHRECAEYAVRACPFLTRPRMRRNTVDLPPDGKVAGLHLDRNPGVALVWITRDYKPFAARGGALFRLGEPEEVVCYAQGRTATRDEVNESIRTGLPVLRDLARQEGNGAEEELERLIATAHRVLDRHCPMAA